MAKDAIKMEKIVALCKRRGFIFQSSEIYGGINGFWDYGPLGVELKRNIKECWWQDMVRNPPIGPDGKEVQMVGVDCSIIMNPKVWVASGHATGFADLMRECPKCNRRFRDDKIWSVGYYSLKEIIPKLVEIGKEFGLIDLSQADVNRRFRSDATLRSALLSANQPRFRKTFEADSYHDAVGLAEAKGLSKAEQKLFPEDDYMLDARPLSAVDMLFQTCPDCSNVLSDARRFNLMFESHAGAVHNEENKVWLRPETAQGIFANFKNVCDSTRVKIPFGIAQVGKAFRNEINPRNYTFRSREFEQMEIEFFCHDSEAMMWWEWWRDVRINWYKSLGLAGENLKPRNQDDKELAHYSKACTDIEYYFPFADEPQELEGVAHRGCFDLTQHQQHSGKDLSYFDDEKKERFVPTVIEPSAGADRSTLAFICEAYTVDPSRPSPELMKFHPRLAPIKAAVFPLVNKDGLPEIAEPLYRELRKLGPVTYDAKQSIGKRYARMDEAGTPYCFTIDGQTKEDGTVTVRDRDTGGQERIDKSRVVDYLNERLRS
ncbi:MAG: glycine--tRNA ligase [Planctomycetota bacterium]|nr:MAG: glycine--tRNA ligase [Planctomycetota bacterium]